MTSQHGQQQEVQRRLEDCQKQVHHYQGMFPRIPTMTSVELVQRLQQQQQHQSTTNSVRPVVLVDVRTQEEQEVSMIPGSLTLEEFHQRMMAQSDTTIDTATTNNSNNAIDGDKIPADAMVVTYCTIGYRSGREAQHLADQYPNFFQIQSDEEEGRQDGTTNGTSSQPHIDDDEQNRAGPNKNNLYNLDGILAYTYVADAPPLQLRTQLGTSVTKQVHTYGPTWDLAHPSYQPVYFRTWNFGAHALQTAGCSVARSVQHTGSTIRRVFSGCIAGCGKRKRR